MIPIMTPDLAQLSTLIGSNYPCLELISMVPKVFEPLKFYCIYKLSHYYFESRAKWMNPEGLHVNFASDPM